MTPIAPESEVGDEKPIDLSACVCTFNRRESLLAALRSLEAVKVPYDTRFEVLVVDNNSSDGTAEAVDTLVSENLPLRYMLEHRQGLSHARNRAICEARGRVIAFLDDDVVVEADWLERLVEAFAAEPRPAVVGGPAFLAADLPRPDWWHDDFAGVAGHFDRGRSVLRSSEGYDGMIGIGANMAFDRHMFERYGRFRSDLGRKGASLAMGEELELLDRLRNGGERLVYDPSVVVHHRPDLGRLSRSYLRRWYFRFGEWRYEHERGGRAVRWLGVPRWRFRRFVEDAAQWLLAMITRRPRDGFLRQLQVIAFGGYLKRAWSRRSGA